MIERLIRPIWTIEPRGFGPRMFRQQFVFAPAFGLLLFVAGPLPSPVLPDQQRGGQRSNAIANDVTEAVEVRPPQTLGLPSGAVAVAPSGWRKTADGWQHVDSWHDVPTMTMRESLDRRRRHTTPLGQSLGRLSQISPWNIAAAQIMCIAVIFRVSKWYAAESA